MNMLKVARGAEQIIAARQRGQRPADMVLVSLGDPVAAQLANPSVFGSTTEKLDWRWVRCLDIGVYITNADNWPAMVKEIALCRPDYLCIWNREEKWGATIYLVPTAEDVEKPVMYWQYEIDFLPWLDFQNKDFDSGKRYGKR